ncbi:MAG: DUF3047 domain-containing protein [bacterium]
MRKGAWKGILRTLLFLAAIASPALTPSPSPGQNASINISNFESSVTVNGAKGLPRGWSLKVWRGRPDFKLVLVNGTGALRMRSEKAAFSLYRGLTVDLKTFPVLNWRWKVTKLPEKGDARVSMRDDQAAGLYIIFPRFPRVINSRIIGYIWDSAIPEGTILESRKNPMVHYIVVRSGRGRLGEWIGESRNVLEDYRKVFGADPPKVGGVSIMIDSDDTRAKAESFFAQIQFNHLSAAKIKSDPNAVVGDILDDPVWSK